MAFQPEYWHISAVVASASRTGNMARKFVIQQHKTGKPHFDLRVIGEDYVRSWSMLRQPPLRPGEQRLAIEREAMPLDAIERRSIYEASFGDGKVYPWDEGEAEVVHDSPQHLLLELRGKKLSGLYDLKRMDWYPGNRWLIRKTGVMGQNPERPK
jgi:bifunctional non-homologous end joining protein LigD